MQKPTIQKTITITIVNAKVRGWVKDQFTLRWPARLQVRDMPAAVAWYVTNRLYDDKKPQDIMVMSYQYEERTYTMSAHNFDIMAENFLMEEDLDGDPMATVDITTTEEKKV